MDFDNPPADPVPQFHAWFNDARERAAVPNPNAMNLATVDADGRVTSRIVLLKQFDERGAVFFTNRQSIKGIALGQHPRAALCFHWDHLDRQIRIEGRVESVSEAESDAYFASRPRESQIGAWASLQSLPLDSRETLIARAAEVEKRFFSRAVDRPPHWGGYRVTLDRIEFWQGHHFRLHDRIEYRPAPTGAWSHQRLYP